MKIVVIEAFFDKNTGEPYNRDGTYESSDENRIEELRAAGVLAPAAVVESTDPDGGEEPPGEPAGENAADSNNEVNADIQPEATPAAATTEKENAKQQKDKQDK